MTQEGRYIESRRKSFIAFPGAESLSAPETTDSPWPPEIKNDPERIRQAAMRTNASRALSVLYEAVPGATEDISTALENHTINDAEALRVYESCAALFNSDPLNNRLALYFPFELISKGTKFSPELKDAQARFTDAYKTAWKSLLREHDLREDFAAGDIIEPEHQKESLPRVVKASHLIPMLMQREVVTFDEVLHLLENTRDTVLQQSIADALAVTKDLDLLSGEHLNRISNSTNRFARNVGIILKNEAYDVHEEVEREEPRLLLKKAAEEWKNEEESLKNLSPLTENRKKWLLNQMAEHIAESYGNRLRPLITDGTLTPDLLQDLVVEQGTSPNSLIVIHAIRTAIEFLAHSNLKTAQNFFTQYMPLLELLRARDSAQVQEEVARTFYHLHALGVLTDHELSAQGLPSPLLGAPAQEVVRSMHKEVKAFTEAAKRIEAHPRLSKMLYPVTALLGSRTKGYASGEADLDAAIFVRPGVQEEERTAMQALTNKILKDAGSGKAMEFWLKEDGGSLAIQDFDNPDAQRGDSSLVHPFLGIWCGDKGAIAELYQKLMPQYVYSKDKKILGEDARAVWLKAMEHDMLQYRLMHKGYDRFRAPEGRIDTSHSDAIDGMSAFYDPGYRRLATKLYIDKVFLPQLSKKQ